MDSESLGNVEVNERLTDDYMTHDIIIPDSTFVYNSRLNITGLKRKLFEGFPIQCLTPLVMDAPSDGYARRLDFGKYDVYVYIKSSTGERDIVVHADTTVNGALWGAYLFYPDSDAYKMILIDKDQKMCCQLDMTEHAYLNGAYAFIGFSEGAYFQKYTFEQKFTKPPLRYTEASLVKAMEENGIGRPSTYASIISVLTKRAYYDKNGKYMVPTELGEVVCDTLTKYFPDIINLKFTANMEKELDSIEEGVEWQSIVSDFYPNFIQEVKIAFYDGNNVKLNAEVSDVPCDKCGAMMVVKEGRYGKFLACPNYPSCKNIKNLHETIVGTCPYCGSDIAKKTSKAGKIFYGCTSYPKCTFALWDLPAPSLCPECNKPMKVVTVKGQTKYVCTACPHSELK